MEITIPQRNWPEELVRALKEAKSGDIIVVSSEARQRLAERAMAQMGITGVTVEARA
jgi:hypothetical protein